MSAWWSPHSELRVRRPTLKARSNPPRLPDGRPDLQGVWDFGTLTPLQRPEEFADRAVLGEEEAAEIEARAAERNAALNAPTTDRSTLLPVGGNVGAYNNFIQLFQTSEHVVILHEMVHDVRVIPLDGRASLPSRIRQWNGDSRGYWEGDTLVVESTNFTDKTASFHPRTQVAAGSAAAKHLVERFRLVGEQTLEYEYTLTDPATFTQPFTVVLPMKRGSAIFEFACHEGNYGLYNVLAGAREQERVAVP